jgi:hypothetical protein
MLVVYLANLWDWPTIKLYVLLDLRVICINIRRSSFHAKGLVGVVRVRLDQKQQVMTYFSARSLHFPTRTLRKSGIPWPAECVPLPELEQLCAV